MGEENQGGNEPQTQSQGVMTPPPPPPPAPPTTGEQPRYGGDERPRRRGGITAGLILVAIGLILLAQQFFPTLAIERFWPVVIIVIGIGIIFRGGRRRDRWS